MDLLKWKKVENEAGYPCYIDEANGKESNDHPHFSKILNTLEEYNGIKYSAYRIAFKLFALQKSLKVPPLRISTGVFSRHRLSLSETSLSIDTVELEAVLADIYFAAEKEGLFSGDVDVAVDLMMNLLLNVYDEERKTPIRVLAAKTLMIVLSEESVAEKWQALAECCADHNGCVTARRLGALLEHVTALPKYLGCRCDRLQADVDACFAESAGMLGISTQAVAEWGVQHCSSTRWLGVVQRVVDSRTCANVGAGCRACGQPLIQVLKFKCSNCNRVYFCEKCYLYGKDLSCVAGHKKTHIVNEVMDGEIKPAECLGFISGMKRFFFCTKTRKKNIPKKERKSKQTRQGSVKKKEKPAVFTSTVSKASGTKASNPAMTLQDIITNMENDTKALKDLMDQLETVAKSEDDQLKGKAEIYYNQISAQIARLKTLKDHFLNPKNFTPETITDKSGRPQAFDLFSPIAVVDERQVTVTKAQPRVLSLDSGNFSVTDKPDSEHLLTMSGDALKPVMAHTTSDTVSTVSMNDMSNFYNETETTKRNATRSALQSSHSISATEQRFAADIRSVESSNDKMRELNADLDTVLDRLQQILTNNFAMDDSCFDNSQLRETASEMEGLLGTLIRGVEQRATLSAAGPLV